MAKKGKIKISKVKRNNQTTNKMRKKGQLKLQRHRTHVQKQKQPTQQPTVEYSSESEAESEDQFGDMLDDEEQQYLMSRLSKQPTLLANIPENEKPGKRSRKRKREKKEKFPKPTVGGGSDSGAESAGLSDSDSDVEGKYEKEQAERPAKKMRPLLPIKTKEGLMERAEECEDSESEQEEEAQKPAKSKQTDKQSDDEDSESDSGMDRTEDVEMAGDEEKVVTAVELMAARRNKLQHDKLRIGALCSSLLENPEKKLKNLFPILYLMEDRLKDGSLNLISVRKLATVSAFEVFKDILPEYMIRHQDYSNIKLKKDTLALYKYEKELLEFYKRYLQRLEKAAGVLRRKKGDTRKVDEPTMSLALVSLRCLCGLLEARPQFNYATNIAQSVVPHLDCRDARARAAVTQCCTNVFAEDTKGDITLIVVRLINQLVKRRNERLDPSALDCLLTLKIRDIDMDAEAEIKHKKKQEEKHKKRIVNLSKKEKKRAKKLKEVERELLETQAQESEMARRKQLTEVTKTVFHIYFRLLKTAPRSKLLAAALNGLAKFTHVINLEYYSDLVAILARLISDELIGARERLLCVRTVLAVLAGAGDALNVDPAKFHAYLYVCMLNSHAGRTQPDSKIILESVSQICARARRVSAAVLQAFAKRAATLAAQLPHHAALACVALLHRLAQQSKAVSTLLEADSEAGGSGRFDPALTSPEHCNAHATALYELSVLARHYHPTVRGAATMLLKGTLPPELNKMTPSQIFKAYDGSEMAFKPSIPPPKKGENQKKKISNAHAWAQQSFKQMCESVENNVSMVISNER
ncbi:nucleolar complex protein 3 homolog [Spodoptera litura]|uniref:NOC3-like protein n=1 Tax=Spodoptera litura TaxID=69820 RepID=A0A9J7ILC0_SPOLT|nr:nucleolar complex protein 3 homolog [Spodoptera litura]